MAILQFEIERGRVKEYVPGLGGTGPALLIPDLLTMALQDTIRNGGTFVVVVSETTITAIQHEDAKPLEAD